MIRRNHLLLLLLPCLLTACDRPPPDRVFPLITRYVRQFKQANDALEAKHYEQAITIYTEILEKEPRNPVAYASRGYAYYKAGDDQEAITNYNTALELEPAYAQVYAWRALSYAFLGQHQQAIHDCQQALKLAPELADAYFGLGHTYFLSEQYRQAVEYYTSAIERDPGKTRFYDRRGLAYNRLGDYQQALDDYNKTLELDPEPDAATYNNRGDIYSNLGHYVQAIADFQKAIETDPDFVMGYANLGSAYANMGDFQNAETYCQQSLQRDEHNCAAHYCLGGVYKALGGLENYTRAITHYTRAMELACEYFDETYIANTYINRGLIKDLMSASSADIIVEYQEALNYDPRHTYAYFLLGEHSDGERAIEYYSKAIELSPEYAVAYLKRGIMYTRQAEVQLAMADFEQAKTLAIHAEWREEAERQLELLETSPSSMPETPSRSPSVPSYTPLPRQMEEGTP